MKSIAKHLWIFSLVLSLLMGGTLASAHSIDHMFESSDSHSDHTHSHDHAHSHSDHTHSWLGELLHPEGSDDELECELAFLASAQTLSSKAFNLQLPLDTLVADIPAGTFAPAIASRLLPPSRAPPVFSCFK